MTIEFLEEAEQELIEAALWYESKEPGLGRRLRGEVAHVVSRIAEDPMLWRQREGATAESTVPYCHISLRTITKGQVGEAGTKARLPHPLALCVASWNSRGHRG